MHSSDVEVRVDQGSLPPPVGSISSPSVIPSSRTDGEVVGSANITPTGWPLIHERDYYVVASNRSETAQPFSITLNGVMPPEADDDDDGLPDIWEEQHFTSIAAYSPSDDADGDGISNLLEFALDLKPNQATSLLHESVKISVEEGRLVMTVNKAISFDTSDLIFTVEASADSEVWNTHETMILTDNPQQLIVADKVPIAEAELRFLRLTVRASP